MPRPSSEEVTRKWKDPPTVAAVRRVRREMLAEADGSIERLLELARDEARGIGVGPGGKARKAPDSAAA